MASYKAGLAADGGICITNYLSALALVIPILLSAGLPPANAVPLFCSDVAHFPERQLTGCAPDDDSPITAKGWHAPREAGPGVPQVVDDLLSQASPNPLVQVGRNGLADGPSERTGTEETLHNRKPFNGISGQVDDNSQGDLSNTISNGENWYYMNVDPDGTYLFLGDPEQLDKLDEWSTAETPDDGLPKGIGIGKKWRF